MYRSSRFSRTAGKYDQVRINFANPDMVGHTGDLQATATCCTLVDKCVKVRFGWNQHVGRLSAYLCIRAWRFMLWLCCPPACFLTSLAHNGTLL